jgi:integrase
MRFMLQRILWSLSGNRIFVRQARVRGHIKCNKTRAGTLEVELQPQAKAVLLSQTSYIGKNDGIVFRENEVRSSKKHT